ncbi:hypothetical protein PVK06_001952 [Gossypium arboreum]|uniref:Uncharacterized protein n=1 Tax=Gossypium arboreum TaxID=29729 RepID=A0ABR0R3P3_GOSAR|nr:hypothetical protein PVK06_001952 [Gossypium arboreum]
MGFKHQERTSFKFIFNGDAMNLNMIRDRVLMSRDWVHYDLPALDSWHLIQLPAILESFEM